jgi:hypothetical protein
MLTLITCTGDRPVSFKLLEQFIAKQTFQKYRWLVIDDGIEPTNCSMGQEYTRNWPRKNNKHSLMNQLKYLHTCYIINTPILFIEDDDWYGREYLDTMNALLRYYDLVGTIPARYYSLEKQGYKIFNNKKHASLAQTGISSNIWKNIDTLLEGDCYLDLRLFAQKFNTCLLPTIVPMHVGLKQLPTGRKGLTNYQITPSDKRIRYRYIRDKNYEKLIEWVGAEDTKLILSTYGVK